MEIWFKLLVACCACLLLVVVARRAFRGPKSLLGTVFGKVQVNNGPETIRLSVGTLVSRDTAAHSPGVFAYAAKLVWIPFRGYLPTDCALTVPLNDEQFAETLAALRHGPPVRLVWGHHEYVRFAWKGPGSDARMVIRRQLYHPLRAQSHSA